MNPIAESVEVKERRPEYSYLHFDILSNCIGWEKEDLEGNELLMSFVSFLAIAGRGKQCLHQW
jgi:hypothetical protein